MSDGTQNKKGFFSSTLEITLLVLCFVFLQAFALVPLFIFLVYKYGWKGIGVWPMTLDKKSLLYLLATVPVGFVSALLLKMFQIEQHIFTRDDFLILCVLSPILEEFLFRQGLYVLIKKWTTEEKALILSAVVFALLHLLDWEKNSVSFVLLQTAFAFPLGILWGRVRQRTGSVLPTIASHFLLNFLIWKVYL
jgi:membrane protease YdiL (CAAX protease family)